MYGFFFFQAEDGIRDSSVTGVQTCALPILPLPSVPAPSLFDATDKIADDTLLKIREDLGERSEERRVRKECRFRWVAYRCKRKLKSIEELILDDTYSRISMGVSGKTRQTSM